MDKSVIQKLIKEVTKAPELEYSDNLLIFKENIESTAEPNVREGVSILSNRLSSLLNPSLSNLLNVE